MNLPPRQRFILFLICSQMFGDGSCSPDWKAIAARSGYTSDEVRITVDELTRMNILVPVTRDTFAEKLYGVFWLNGKVLNSGEVDHVV